MPALPQNLDREALARLSPSERRRVHELLSARVAGEGLADYIARTRPDEAAPRHLRPIINLFERARRGERVRACISMPPRSGKSTTIRSAIAWWLAQFPADTIAYCAYNSDISDAQSYKIREEAEKLARVPMARNRRAVDDWGTAFGGGLISAGTNTGLTSRGVTGFAVVDDPFKGQQDADSANNREHVWDWFNRVVMTRLEGWASIIVCQTRWNEDDLVGRLAAEGDWEIISIAAICEDEEDDPLGRKIGESFWPERPQFEVEYLNKLRKRDEYGFLSLYQQTPRSRGARLFGPHRTYNVETTDLRGCTAIIGADPAATESTVADFSWAVLLAIRNPHDIDKAEAYVIRAIRQQTSVPQFARDLLAFQRRGYNAPVVVEAVSGFKAVPQLLREAAPALRIKEVTSRKDLHGDKFQRAQGFANAWNNGRVFVPDNAPEWLEDYLFELSRFTGVRGADDQDGAIDASSHAWNHTVARPKVRREATPAVNRWPVRR